jgi:hypothetical protein
MLVNLLLFRIEFERSRVSKQSNGARPEATSSRRSGRIPPPALGVALALCGIAPACGTWLLVSGHGPTNWLSSTTDPPEPGSAQVPFEIASEPEHANVIPDGRSRGQTPISMHVTPGEHSLGLRQPDAVAFLADGPLALATWLALDTAAASRYHGLIDSSLGQARRGARLFLALPHTLGANAVFVAMSVAAQTAARHGGADELLEWRSAATCERRRCKPDGYYGCHRRNAVGYGFLLEYERGTEPGGRYAAKCGAYYRYRDSGDAARDSGGFPTLLFVTTDPVAEPRIADQAFRAWLTRDTEPLPVLITTTERIVDHREGILGPIWRTPALARSRAAAARDYWLPGGPPRALCGAWREPVRTLRLVWPTAADSRLSPQTGGIDGR